MIKFIKSRFGKAEKPKVIKSQTPYRPQAVGPVGGMSFWEYVLAGGGRVTPRMAMQYYRDTAAIATSVDMIAGAVEQMAPVLKIDGEIVDEHEVLELLQQPNGFETRSDFLGKLSRHYLLTHNGYIAAFGKVTRGPLELYAIKPQLINSNPADDGYVGSYNIMTGIGAGAYVRDTTPLRPRGIVRYVGHGGLRELYHIAGFSSRDDDTQADSPLEAAALEARQLIKGKMHNIEMLENGGRLSMLVTILDDDQADAEEAVMRKDRIKEQLESSGGIAVINGADTKISELGKSNKDMDFANLESTASTAIYMRYGIPLPLVTTDAATFSNVESAILYFYEHTVLPHYDVLASGLSKMLLPRYGLDPSKASLTYDKASVKVLAEQALKELKARRDMNLETVNELREIIPGREPIDGGDVLYQPGNLLPIGSEIIPDLPNPDDAAAKGFLD